MGVQHDDIDHTGITGVGGSVATDTIWNAAGDLAVGTGSDTAARLAIGAAGGHLSRINGAVAWDSGTANPGSAAAGDRFWRTDIQGGLAIFYDGAQWLSQQIFSLHQSNTGSTSVAIRPNLTGPFGTYDMFVERMSVSMYVDTTNTGSAYWTAQLQKNVLNTWNNVGSAVNTSAISPNDFALLTVDLDTAASLATTATFGILFDKVGSPGQLTAGGTVYYRLIIT